MITVWRWKKCASEHKIALNEGCYSSILAFQAKKIENTEKAKKPIEAKKAERLKRLKDPETLGLILALRLLDKNNAKEKEAFG